ncbi:acyltransferase family protein [Neobacillus jeddahensis]|uniref:acyltransferase family protein n=1 Tax=Neobacillus jeddahensis TaxID=1461580 RepID=UPI00058FCCED
MNLDINKKDTEILKGIAITLMVIHHLFRFPEKLNGISYIETFSFGSLSFEFLIADFGKVCIGIFVFLSGYGYYIISLRKVNYNYYLNKLYRILINTYLIFIIFVPIGLRYFNYDKNLLIQNLLLLRFDYNPEWWFLSTYILLLLITPVILKLFNYNYKYTILASTIFFVSSLFFQQYNEMFEGHIFLNQITNVMFWQIIFVVGIFFSRYKLFSQINQLVKRLSNHNVLIAYLLILSVIFFRLSLTLISKKLGIGNNTWFDFIVVPIFLYCSLIIIKNKFVLKILKILGEHSTNIWLTHTFLSFYYIPKIIFYPKISFLILINLLVCSLIISIVINFLVKMVHIFITSISDMVVKKLMLNKQYER